MDRDTEQRKDGDDIIEISEEIEEIEEVPVSESASESEPAPGAAPGGPTAPFGAAPYAFGWQRVLTGQVFKQYYRFFFAFLAIFVGSCWSRMTISDPQVLSVAAVTAEARAEEEGEAEEGAATEVEPVIVVPQVDVLHTAWGPVFLFIGALGVLAMGMAILSPRFQIRFGPIFLAVVPFVWGFYYFSDVLTATEGIGSFGGLVEKAAPGENTDFDAVGYFFRNLGPGFYFIWIGALVVELSFIGSIFASLSAEKKKKKEAQAARSAARGDKGRSSGVTGRRGR